jgi:hypothetical protein
MEEEQVQLLNRRLTRIEEILSALLEVRTRKDFYSTSEVAEILEKAEFTVREWCRLGRVHALKRSTGRGRSQEWMIPDEELNRIRNEGLLPLPSYSHSR